MLDLRTLYEPPSAEAYEALKVDIAVNGIRNPILVTEDGTILDGHMRHDIAAELGKDCPRQVMSVNGEDAMIAVAVLYNERHRKMDAAQRATVVSALNREGWSNVRIAEVLGVGATTVRRALEILAESGPTAPFGAVGPKTTGTDGKTRPSTGLTPEQREARRDAVVAYQAAGYKRNDIADALGIGHGTVDSDLKARGIDNANRIGRRVDKPPPVDWLALAPPPQPRKPRNPKPQPPPPDTPRWRLSRVMPRVTVLYETIAEEDGVNMHAWDVDAAITAKDDDAREWLKEVTKQLTALADQVGRLLRVTTDRKYRREVMTTTEGSETIRSRKLRAVTEVAE